MEICATVPPILAELRAPGRGPCHETRIDGRAAAGSPPAISHPESTPGRSRDGRTEPILPRRSWKRGYLTQRLRPTGSSAVGTVAVDAARWPSTSAAPDPEHRRRERQRQDDRRPRRCSGSPADPTAQALYRGKDIYHLNKDEMRTYRKEVQAVFQDPYGIYNPYYRIDRVFDMTIKKFKLASSKAEKRDLIEEALRAVNLRPPDVLGRYPHQLSGGERQRVMLARAYMLRPKVIIADEPISMLDVAVRAILMNIFLDFKERYGMSTHLHHPRPLRRLLPRRRHHGHVPGAGRRGRSGRRRDGDPAHPYTQLLLGSIPSPDPDQSGTRSHCRRAQARPTGCSPGPVPVRRALPARDGYVLGFPPARIPNREPARGLLPLPSRGHFPRSHPEVHNRPPRRSRSRGHRSVLIPTESIRQRRSFRRGGHTGRPYEYLPVSISSLCA